MNFHTEEYVRDTCVGLTYPSLRGKTVNDIMRGNINFVTPNARVDKDISLVEEVDYHYNNICMHAVNLGCKYCLLSKKNFPKLKEAINTYMLEEKDYDEFPCGRTPSTRQNRPRPQIIFKG